MESAEPNQNVDLTSLELQADRNTLQMLHKAGHLNAEARDAALTLLAGELQWWRWINRLLLFAGAALVLAGVVYFFAYNWAEIGWFSKFALIEAGIVVCIAGAWSCGLHKITGQVFLTAAAVMVGVLLAVYAQVYQTGTDEYELFFGWWLLIAGWVVIGKFGALWIIWLALLNIAIIMYWQQGGDFALGLDEASMFVVLGLLNSLFLAGREFGAHRGMAWLKERWLQGLLLLSVLTYFIIPTIMGIVEIRHASLGNYVSFPLFVLVIYGCYKYFRHYSPDMQSLTLTALYFCTALLTLIGRVLFELGDDEWIFLLFTLIIVGVISAVSYWLMQVAEGMKGEAIE
ncbi:DUF2157 domain-containing protein [Planctomycetota bacterium]